MASFINCKKLEVFALLCAFFGLGQLMLFINLSTRSNRSDKQANGASVSDVQQHTMFERNGGKGFASEFRPSFGEQPSAAHRKKEPKTAICFQTDSIHADNTFLCPFHRHWETNCSALFAGDKDVVRNASQMLGKERDRGNGSIAVPDDAEVRTWTRNCASYTRLRRYPTTPGTEEEAGFPVAYIIVTHKDAAQVERLLRAIYQPQNLYCIHPDAKSSEDFHQAIKGITGCFENVFVASKLEEVQYFGYTRLLADVNCMRDLTGTKGVVYRWKYVMNLCGQDFPLKTNLEIVRQLKAYKGHNDITGVIPPSYIISRTRYRHIVKDRRVVLLGHKKTPAPHNLTIHFGNAYYAATRRFVEYILTSPQGIDLLEWSNDTYSPDEHYWATLQRAPGTPGGYPYPTWDGNVRFMKWGDIKTYPACRGKYVRALCVFGIAYLEYLATQPHLFANKFHYNYDPVTLQCIEEALSNRTRNPAESDKLPNFPVTNLVWQNHTPTF